MTEKKFVIKNVEFKESMQIDLIDSYKKIVIQQKS